MGLSSASTAPRTHSTQSSWIPLVNMPPAPPNQLSLAVIAFFYNNPGVQEVCALETQTTNALKFAASETCEWVSAATAVFSLPSANSRAASTFSRLRWRLFWWAEEPIWVVSNSRGVEKWLLVQLCAQDVTWGKDLTHGNLTWARDPGATPVNITELVTQNWRGWMYSNGSEPLLHTHWWYEVVR